MPNRTISADLLLEYGFHACLTGYSIIIENRYLYKEITVSHNDKDTYYVYFRDGVTKEERHRDDLVCLRSDAKFIITIEEIYHGITDKHLIKKPSN